MFELCEKIVNDFVDVCKEILLVMDEQLAQVQLVMYIIYMHTLGAN